MRTHFGYCYELKRCQVNVHCFVLLYSAGIVVEENKAFIKKDISQKRFEF